jgi:hypothetical protein
MRTPSDDLSREVGLLVIAHELARVLKAQPSLACPFCGPGCEPCITLSKFDRFIHTRYGKVPTNV